MTRAALAGRVVRWQRLHGRHGLPWQASRDPYPVWLSEVMLQQTQVATVLPYYARFTERFPSVQALAAASLDDVLALWSGLGYYSRARNLHRCAQQVVAQHGGAFPASSAALVALPGIGRSTAAAIAAFCFGERVAILDVNVKRVLARALGFDGDLSLAAEVQRLWAAAESLLPTADVDVYTQGLMDLGASVCTARSPQCQRCPLAADCVAFATGTPERFPVKTRRNARGLRDNALLWLRRGDRMLLVRRPTPGVWAGLWSLPEFSSTQELSDLLQGSPGSGEWLAPIRHALTHFEWRLQVLRWEWPLTEPVPADLAASGSGRWFRTEQALALGLPAPLRKLLSAEAQQPTLL